MEPTCCVTPPDELFQVSTIGLARNNAGHAMFHVLQVLFEDKSLYDLRVSSRRIWPD
jgi:hypothetical protein